MVSKSKNRKLSQRKEFIVENRDAGTTSISEIGGVELDTGHLRAIDAGSALAGVTAEERHQLIAEGAYFRAERRNFAPGYELEDWLGSEAEIDVKLSKTGLGVRSRDA